MDKCETVRDAAVDAPMALAARQLTRIAGNLADLANSLDIERMARNCGSGGLLVSLRTALGLFASKGTIVAAAILAASTTYAQIAGPTMVNGNGFSGTLTVDPPGSGDLTGTFYTAGPFQSPLFGHYGAGSRWFVALRGDLGNPSQAWIGRYDSGRTSVDGEIHALLVAEGGGSPWRNIFAFAGNRPGPMSPSAPGSLPRRLSPAFYNAHPSSVSGIYQMTGNGFAGDLRIGQQTANGQIAGTIYGNDRISGHYAWQTGTVVFVRYRGNDPIQLFRGTARNPALPKLEGSFFPLNATGGSSQATSAFDWETTSGVPIPPRSGLLREFPFLHYGAVGVVADFKPGQATHSAPQRIETSCPLDKGLTFFRQRAVDSNRIQVAPGDVAVFSSPNHRQEVFWLCATPSPAFQASAMKRTICDSPGANIITVSRSGVGSRVYTRCYWSPDVPH